MNIKSNSNINYFYNLSMSIGQSFVLHEIYEDFSKALLRDTNLACLSIWFYDDYFDKQNLHSSVSLEYTTCKKSCDTDDILPVSHKSFQIEDDKNYKFTHVKDATTDVICPDNRNRIEGFYLLRLEDIGFIKLYYKVKESDCIAHIEKSKMLEVISKFAASIKRCLEFNSMSDKASKNELLVAAINQSADILVVIKTNGIVEYVNKSFEKAYGYSQKKTIGKPLGKFISHPPLHRTYVDILRAVSIGNSWRGTVETKIKGGILKNFDITVAPVYSQDKIIRYVMAQRDVTKTLELEERLRQSQKMESLGTLAGGIAHDFNNILFSVMGNLELALESFEDINAMKRSLIDAYAASSKAQGLVKQILSFSRKQKIKKESILVSKAIKDAVNMIKASVPSSVTINSNIEKDGFITADPSQFNQVLVNLCTNAYKAIKNNGSIILQTREIKQPDMKICRPILNSKSNILVLEVVDNGKGIPKDIIDKIFDPFFTTRDVGEGTGLGLAMVHGVIESLGGRIFVESTVNVGTVFTLYIPVVNENNIHENNHIAVEPDKEIISNQKLLIVDDEILVGSLYKRGLKKRGFRVSYFDKPLEALKHFAENADDFDLVITDMMMPKMTGNILANEIRKIKPDMPIIICSGYSSDAELEKEFSTKNYKFVEKPVVIKKLVKLINKILADTDK